MQTFDQALLEASTRTARSRWTRRSRPPPIRTTSSCSSRPRGSARRRWSRSTLGDEAATAAAETRRLERLRRHGRAARERLAPPPLSSLLQLCKVVGIIVGRRGFRAAARRALRATHSDMSRTRPVLSVTRPRSSRGKWTLLIIRDLADGCSRVLRAGTLARGHQPADAVAAPARARGGGHRRAPHLSRGAAACRVHAHGQGPRRSCR